MNKKLLLTLIVCLILGGAITTVYAQDSDGDGHSVPADCDDTNPNIYPGAPEEEFDDIDSNCDGQDNPADAPPTDSDGDGIPDSNDGCPSVPGVPQFDGCPDSDGDGIPDSSDPCPTEFGPAASGGCPDRDNDRVLDRDDACPDQAGDPALGGCPDADRDGIIDSQDACPNQFGPLATGGCPDADADGIQDTNDACPSAAGPAEFDGCPDSDGDGLRDNVDECPTLAGTAENNGCQFFDSDLDGVNDDEDECPNEAGVAENFGCPEQITILPIFVPEIQVVTLPPGPATTQNLIIRGTTVILDSNSNQETGFECKYIVNVNLHVSDGDLVEGRTSVPMRIEFVVNSGGSPLAIVMDGKGEYTASSAMDAEGEANFSWSKTVDCLDTNPETATVTVSRVWLRSTVLLSDEYQIDATSVTYFVKDLSEYTLFDFAADKGSFEHNTLTTEAFGTVCNKGNALHCDW